jgi:hypothetical protein
MPNSLTLQLPEVVVPGMRLGRHIRHDPRSLQYLVPETDKPETVEWERRIPILDQGNLGSCTGNALTGALGTSPNYEQLPAQVQSSLNETFAVQAYSWGTAEDSYPGQYPPEDTGCDGLTLAMVAKEHDWSPGNTHITSLAAAHEAIKHSGFMTGVSWMSGMDNPNSEGVVHATGRVRGGHEPFVTGYNATTGLWKVANSWSDSWGKDGYFYLPDEDYDKLLKDQGDATVVLPLTADAPTPQPPPAPAGFPLDQYNGFKAHPIKNKNQFVKATDAWLAAGGK